MKDERRISASFLKKKLEKKEFSIIVEDKDPEKFKDAAIIADSIIETIIEKPISDLIMYMHSYEYMKNLYDSPYGIMEYMLESAEMLFNGICVEVQRSFHKDESLVTTSIKIRLLGDDV